MKMLCDMATSERRRKEMEENAIKQQASMYRSLPLQKAGGSAGSAGKKKKANFMSGQEWARSEVATSTASASTTADANRRVVDSFLKKGRSMMEDDDDDTSSGSNIARKRSRMLSLEEEFDMEQEDEYVKPAERREMLSLLPSETIDINDDSDDS